MANAWALDVRVPLFDRALAEASFRLPPQMKLHGACEKYVLKLVLQKHLPRRDRLAAEVRHERADHRLGAGPAAPRRSRSCSGRAVAGPARAVPGRVRRAPAAGPERAGRDAPAPHRRAAVGAGMLEAWLRVFVDGRGRRPEGGLGEVHPLRPRQQVQGARRTGAARAAGARSPSSRRRATRSPTRRSRRRSTRSRPAAGCAGASSTSTTRSPAAGAARQASRCALGVVLVVVGMAVASAVRSWALGVLVARWPRSGCRCSSAPAPRPPWRARPTSSTGCGSAGRASTARPRASSCASRSRAAPRGRSSPTSATTRSTAP